MATMMGVLPVMDKDHATGDHHIHVIHGVIMVHTMMRQSHDVHEYVVID